MAGWNRSRTIAVGGIVTALVLAGGGVAMAQSQGDAATSPTATIAAKTGHKDRDWLRVASRIEHGQFVVRGKSGPVTRDLINGTVASVSSTGITVRAADGVEDSFAVTSQTKVRVRTDGKGTASSISKVAVGDHVVVLGTGTTALTANRVVDIKR